MDTNSNSYIYIFSSVMVIIVAAALSLAATGLKERQDKNVEIEKKQNLLSCVLIESTVEDAEAKFDQHIVEKYTIDHQGKVVDAVDPFTIDMKAELAKSIEERHMPVFIAKLDDGSTKTIIPVRGTGLWGPIWGYVSLNDDNKTIYGAVFDHKSETPGLGAEISSYDQFQKQFEGKTIELGSYDPAKEAKQQAPVLAVTKGMGEGNPNAVDGISGGTITSKGVQYMLTDCLGFFSPYFNQTH